MERQEVYKRIDQERDYQDWRWDDGQREDRVMDEEKSPAEWLNYIEMQIDYAKIANYELNKEEVMNHIRKIAGLAVRAMEIHGCPERKIPETN